MKIKEIVKHFGKKEQIIKAKEELIELLAALNRNDTENIIEEIADVEIMLEQLKYIYMCASYVEIIKQCKVDRTLKIISGECTVQKADRPNYCGKTTNACEKCRKEKLNV